MTVIDLVSHIKLTNTMEIEITVFDNTDKSVAYFSSIYDLLKHYNYETVQQWELKDLSYKENAVVLTMSVVE